MNLKITNVFKEVFTHGVYSDILASFKTIFESLSPRDMEVMSEEVKQILSNPEDARKFKEAVRKIEEHKEKEVTIELSNHTKLTLVQ